MIDERTPSQHRALLRSITNTSIIRMTRYRWWPKERVARDHELPPELVFSRTAGPLLCQGLHDDSDDFSVLVHDDVKPTLWPELRAIAGS